MYNVSCVCSFGFYTTANSVSCTNTCSSNCNRCFRPNYNNSQTTCSICKPGYMVSGTTCAVCPANTFTQYKFKDSLTDEGNAYSYCLNCHSSCNGCTNYDEYSCTNCKSGFHKYTDVDSGQTTCIFCDSNLGYFVKGGLCYKCGPNCQACNPNLETECTACLSNFYLKTDTNTCDLCTQDFYYKSGL